MIRKCLLGMVVFAMPLLTPATSFAQSQGAWRDDFTGISAFVFTPTVNIEVFGQRDESTFGSWGQARLTIFDLTTFQFSQCANVDFAMTVNPAKTSLSFTSEESASFNCLGGQQIEVTCEPAANSSILHSISNGVRIEFGERQTTHVQSDSYNYLACTIDALGSTYSGGEGFASHEVRSVTP